VDASFDNGKIDAYRSEVRGRVSLAQVFRTLLRALMRTSRSGERSRRGKTEWMNRYAAGG
jgi:hypothetical protein